MANRRALVIGVSEYDSLPSLETATSDATQLGEVLKDPWVGAFDATTLRNPAHQEVKTAVENLFDRSQDDDTVVLHFSCHGLIEPDGELYLAASDTDPENVRDSAIPMGSLAGWIRSSRSRGVVLLLDVCSWSFGGGMGQEPKRDAGQELSRAGAASLVSYYPSRHSLFTRSLVEGLLRRQTDLNGDGQIDLSELHSYIRGRMAGSQDRDEYALLAAGQMGVSLARSLPAFSARNRLLLDRIVTGEPIAILPGFDHHLHRLGEARRDPPRRASRQTPREAKRRWALWARSFGAVFDWPSLQVPASREREGEPAWDRLQRLLAGKYAALSEPGPNGD